MGARPRAARRRRAGLLGGLRLPQLRRSVERAAVRGRLTWQLATVVELAAETARTRTLVLEPAEPLARRARPGTTSLEPAEPLGNRAGQHVDVRLTADDGYQAQRSYSIASAPDDEHPVLTIERLVDCEVSPYLVDELRPGDEIELRGPIGGHFTWGVDDG